MIIPEVDTFGFTEDYQGGVRIDSMMVRTSVDPRDPRYDQVLGDGYYLVVGESPESMYGGSQADPNFQLLVTKDGVAINASPTEWNSEYGSVAADGAVGVGADSTYSLFVNGPVKIKGTLTVLGDIVFGNIRGQAGAVGSGSGFWYSAADTATQTHVYTPNLVSIAPRDWAQASRHRLAVVGNANYDQDQLQVAVNNRQGAGGRIGVVSDVAGSPWVFAPFAGCAIEMYGADAVARTYTGGRVGLGALYDVSNGLATYPAGTFVPSLRVDPGGTVLVNATKPTVMTWTATSYDAAAGVYVTSSQTRPPEMQVAGTLAADAVLVRDMDGALKNIREIFPDRDSAANELVPAGRVVNTIPGKEGFAGGTWTFGAAAPASTAVVVRGATPEGTAALTVRSGGLFVEGEVRASRGVFDTLELTGAQTFDLGDGSDIRAGTIEVTNQFVYRGQTVNFSVADPDFDPSAMFSFQGSYAATNYRLRVGGAVHPYIRPGVLSMWNDGEVAGHTATFAFRADPALPAEYVQEAHVGHLTRGGDLAPADGIYEVPFAVVTRPGFGGVRAPFAVFPENTAVSSTATVADDVPTILAYAGRFGVNVQGLGDFGAHDVFLNGTVFGQEFHTPSGRLIGFTAGDAGLHVAGDGEHVGIRGAPDARYPVRLAGDVLVDGGIYNASGKRLGWWDFELTGNVRSAGTVKTHMHVGIGAVPESEYALDVRSPDTGGATAIRLLRGEAAGVRVVLENTGSASAEMRVDADLAFSVRDALGQEATPLRIGSSGVRVVGDLDVTGISRDLEVRGAVTATAFRLRAADGSVAELPAGAPGIDVLPEGDLGDANLYLRGSSVDLSFARRLSIRESSVTASSLAASSPVNFSMASATGRIAHFENASAGAPCFVGVSSLTLGDHGTGSARGIGLAVGDVPVVRVPAAGNATVVLGAGAGATDTPCAVQVSSLPVAASPALGVLVQDSPPELGATVLLRDVSETAPWSWRVSHTATGLGWERSWQTAADPAATPRYVSASGVTAPLPAAAGTLPAGATRLELPAGTTVTLSVAGTAVSQTFVSSLADTDVLVDLAETTWDAYAVGSVPVEHRRTTLAHDSRAGRLFALGEARRLSPTTMDAHEYVLAAESGARLLLASPAGWEGGAGAGVFLKTSPGGDFGASTGVWDFGVRADADGKRLRVQATAAGEPRDMLVLDPEGPAALRGDLRVAGRVDATNGFYVDGNLVMGTTAAAMILDRDLELRTPASHLRFTVAAPESPADIIGRPFVRAMPTGALALGTDLPDEDVPAELWHGPATLSEPAPGAGLALSSAFGAGGTTLATAASPADLVRVYVRPDVSPVGPWVAAQDLAVPGARTVAADGEWLAIVSVQLARTEIYRWTGSWYRHERSVLAANDDGVIEVPEDVRVCRGRLFAALTSARGGWRAWDLGTGDLVAGSPEGFGGVVAVATSVHATSRLVTVSYDGRAHLWEDLGTAWTVRAELPAAPAGQKWLAAAMSGSAVVLGDGAGIQVLRVGADVPGWSSVVLAHTPAGLARVGVTRRHAIAVDVSGTALLAWDLDAPEQGPVTLAAPGVSAGDGFGEGFAVDETRALVAAASVDVPTDAMTHVFWEFQAGEVASVNVELEATGTALRKPAVAHAGVTVVGGDLVHTAASGTVLRAAATGHVSFHAPTPRTAPYGGAHPFDVASGFALGAPGGTVANEVFGPTAVHVDGGAVALDVQASSAATDLLRVATVGGGSVRVAAGGTTEIDVPEDLPGTAGLTVRMGLSTRTALLVPGGAEVTAEGRTYLGPGAATDPDAAEARLVSTDGDVLLRGTGGQSLRVFSAGVAGPERLLVLRDGAGARVLDVAPNAVGVFATADASLAALRVAAPAGGGDLAVFEADGNLTVRRSGAVDVEVADAETADLLRVANAAGTTSLALQAMGTLSAVADLHVRARGTGGDPLVVAKPAGGDLLRLTSDGDVTVLDTVTLAASESAAAIGAPGIPRGADTLPQSALTVHPIPDAIAPGADGARIHAAAQDGPALRVAADAGTHATAVRADDLSVPCAATEGRAATTWTATLDASGAATFSPALDVVTAVSRPGALLDAAGAVIFRATAAGPLPRGIRGVASFSAPDAPGASVELSRAEASPQSFRVGVPGGPTRLAAGARGVEMQGLRFEVPDDAPDTCYVM